MEKKEPIAIVGCAESELGKVPHKTVLELHAEATAAALEDAGLSLKDINGLCTAFNPISIMDQPSVTVAEYLGIVPTFTDSTAIGGSAFLAHVEHAAAAIRDGLCDTVLVTYASTQLSDRGTRVAGDVYLRAPMAQYEMPYGPHLPISSYAMAAQRHMHRYGTTSEQLAEIAVAARRWAALNPVAFVREPITVDDVVNSPMISSPLHRLDCCVVTDGGGAVIVTTLDRARDLKKRPIMVLGSGESHAHRMISQMPDVTTTVAVETGKRAFGMAGLTPADVDVALIYDSFTITALISLEDLGFCGKGEGGSFVEGQRLGPGGSLPVNPMGGGLSYCHPGMLGIFLVIEAVRQLRGECGDRQVPDAEVALCHGTGGQLSSHATLLLGRS